MQKQFTGDENIAEILLELPESYEIFASYGLHCAGCPISPMESLKDGAASHGIRDRAWEMLLTDLNEMAAEKSNS